MIKHLLFDLDNTLYPSSAPINANITRRMTGFVADFLQVSPEEAAEKRKEGLRHFGTTLEWLTGEHGLTAEGRERFFSAVHPPEEKNEVPVDENLRPFLLSLDMPMSLLTNAPYEHAERILKRLKVLDLFKVICDLRGNNLQGKPAPAAYLRPIEQAGFTVEETLFIDDYVKYIKGYSELGGTAVLVDQNNKHSAQPCLRINSIYQLPEILEEL